MKETLTYNIHGALKVHIVRDRRRDWLRELNLPLSYFETGTQNDCPNITLNLEEFNPARQNSFVVDHKYHIDANYFYAEHAESRSAWKVEILGFEHGDTVINFDGSGRGLARALLPDFLGQNVYLRCLLQYKLTRLGRCMVHAAGVCKDGRAYVLAGRGGAFKTSLAMDLVRKAGFGFLGDDLVILHEKQALAFPWHRGIFDFRVDHLESEALGGSLDKLRLLRYLHTFDSNLSVVDIPTKPVNVHALLLAVKTETSRVGVEQVPLEIAIPKLVSSIKMELMVSPQVLGMDTGVYFDYMQAYSFVFPDSSIACYWDDFSQALRNALQDIPVYKVTIPKTYSPDLFEQFHKVLETLD